MTKVKKLPKTYLPNNTYKAKPKEKVPYDSLLREVEERTGFKHADIRIVFLAFIDVLVETMLARKVVVLPKIGLIFPSIKRGRYYTNFQAEGGNGKIYHPSRWVLRFQPGAFITRKLLEIEVSQQEEDEMYSHLKK